MAYRRLRPDELRYSCDPAQFEFETTKSVRPLEGIIGQERAVCAMEFGLAIKRHSYNIFMTGMTGTGKISYAQTLINEVAATEKAPADWCYVYNFENPSHPVALNLPCSLGARFSKDMAELVESLKMEIPKAFDADDYERQKAEIFKEFQEIRAYYFDELTKMATEEGFVLRRASTGFVSVPLIDGKELKLITDLTIFWCLVKRQPDYQKRYLTNTQIELFVSPWALNCAPLTWQTLWPACFMKRCDNKVFPVLLEMLQVESGQIGILRSKRLTA
ncbi:MAG: hypothetical protein DDT30_00051 [Dehalococcoidia bacterium]|nr:hypothetical protein [Bacillota bacterium]MBT9142180.1 hypothetical protein [Bacillota bacterium]